MFALKLNVLNAQESISFKYLNNTKMENSKNQIIGLCVAAALTFSCNNGGTNRYGNENDTIDNATSSDTIGRMDGGRLNRGTDYSNNDTVNNYREGTPINERAGSMDTIQLPAAVVTAIDNDTALQKAMIVEKIKLFENGETLYQVAFYPVNGREQTITFDNQGQRKQNNRR
jgi:hypothetical protein